MSKLEPRLSFYLYDICFRCIMFILTVDKKQCVKKTQGRGEVTKNNTGEGVRSTRKHRPGERVMLPRKHRGGGEVNKEHRKRGEVTQKT